MRNVKSINGSSFKTGALIVALGALACGVGVTRGESPAGAAAATIAAVNAGHSTDSLHLWQQVVASARTDSLHLWS